MSSAVDNYDVRAARESIFLRMARRAEKMLRPALGWPALIGCAFLAARPWLGTAIRPGWRSGVHYSSPGLRRLPNLPTFTSDQFGRDLKGKMNPSATVCVTAAAGLRTEPAPARQREAARAGRQAWGAADPPGPHRDS